jgi:hypothetical protein
LAAPYAAPQLIGALGIAAFLLCLHFGFADILTFAVQSIGFPVTPLFDAPWRSRSLRDFWSRRWNRAFVEMDTLLFWPTLRRYLSTRNALFGVFIISGLLHEGGLSYPAWGGWGLPLIYFCLHGFLVALEVRWRIEKKWPRCLAHLWSYFWILVPLPLLFHAPFRETVAAPLFVALHNVITQPLEWWFSLALRLAAIGHGCILMASFQVPSRLKWHEDLQKLSPFNRKIMWNYGAFIVMLILAFGALTWFLHAEMMRGDRAALGLALLIGGFWSARVLVDFFYFKQEDWPRGPLFVVGHVLLTGLFIALASTYLGLVI